MKPLKKMISWREHANAVENVDVSESLSDCVEHTAWWLKVHVQMNRWNPSEKALAKLPSRAARVMTATTRLVLSYRNFTEFKQCLKASCSIQCQLIRRALMEFGNTFSLEFSNKMERSEQSLPFLAVNSWYVLSLLASQRLTRPQSNQTKSFHCQILHSRVWKINWRECQIQKSHRNSHRWQCWMHCHARG